MSLSDIAPPNNPQAEVAVISTIILWPDSISRVQDYLEPKDFFHAQYGKIYETLLQMWEETTRIDLITLRDKLEANGYLEMIGGEAGLAQIMGSEQNITSAHIVKYSKAVKEDSLRRKLIILGDRLNSNARNLEKPLGNLMDSFDLSYSEVEEEFTKCYREEGMSFSTAFEEVLTRRAGTIKGFRCGIPFVDEATLGLKRDHLWVVYASSGAGKTFAGIQMAMEALRQGARVRFLSLEMSAEEVWDRLTVMEQRGDRDDSTAYDRISKWNLTVDDTTFSMAKIRRYIKLNAPNTDLFVIDYLGLVETGERGVSEIENIITASRELQKCAKKNDVCVLALAQDNTNPQAEDYDVTIKGGASVRAVADVILKLKRIIDFPDDPALKSERMKVWLQKNRHGRGFLGREYPVDPKTGEIVFREEWFLGAHENPNAPEAEKPKEPPRQLGIL